MQWHTPYMKGGGNSCVTWLTLFSSRWNEGGVGCHSHSYTLTGHLSDRFLQPPSPLLCPVVTVCVHMKKVPLKLPRKNDAGTHRTRRKNRKLERANAPNWRRSFPPPPAQSAPDPAPAPPSAAPPPPVPPPLPPSGGTAWPAPSARLPSNGRAAAAGSPGAKVAPAWQ